MGCAGHEVRRSHVGGGWSADTRVASRDAGHFPVAPASIIFWIFSRLNEPGDWLGG
jgi:hypothetical protein